MKKIVNQHGDVVLEAIECIPTDAKAVKLTQGHTIEMGEGGHRHTLVCDKPLSEMADKIELYEKDGILFLSVKSAVKITHEEHGEQIVNPGIYRKNIERQFDYENEVERKVID